MGATAVRDFAASRRSDGMARRLRETSRIAFLAGTLFSPFCAVVSLGAHAAPEVLIHVLSSRPEAVSGDDVLVELGAPIAPDWRVQLNGRDVAASFRLVEKSGRSVALLNGLKLGENVLEVKASAAVTQKIVIIAHSLAGPIFSGPHQGLFVCQTEVNGLGRARGSDCSAKTIVQYYYKSTEPVEINTSAPILPAPNLAPGFKAYNPAAPQPSDLSATVTSDGRTVPYIVRREVGVINRAVYDIEFLHRPGQPLPTPWTGPTPGWNGRLIFLVDGGCGPGHIQGTLRGPVGAAGEPFLAAGYARAAATLTVAAVDCNDHVAAETLAMVKEHFIKEYGEPVHTIGWGESGGAINQLLTAQNFPGLLDGLITGLSFPDLLTTAQSLTDCALLNRAFDRVKKPWSDAQKAAASGFFSWQTCNTGIGWPVLDPVKLCPPQLPKEMIYDRTTKPDGVRCDLYENEVNILGRNPRTGFAYRPLDNVGVQYGLTAFNRRQISSEQFVELNELIGGFDDDGRVIPARMAADPQSLRNAYNHGLVLTGGGGLSQVPIIDWRHYWDDSANNHDSVRSFITRARLVASNGSADNQVILRFPRSTVSETVSWLSFLQREEAYPDESRYLMHEMDRWLDSIAADRNAGPLANKVGRDKPRELADGCWTAAGEHIAEPAVYGAPNRCNQQYPVYGDTRIAAGGPLTDDVLKCSLKPFSAAEYGQPLSAQQQRRLRNVFPTGVCDYTRPGVGQEITRRVRQIN